LKKETKQMKQNKTKRKEKKERDNLGASKLIGIVEPGA